MRSVLLVDDDNICNYIATKMLNRIGIMDIHMASNGKQALDQFKQCTLPLVILLDLNMPIMDGFGFMEAFQQLNLEEKDKVKIVILSSSANRSDVERAMQLGATKFLSKPIHEDTLRDVLGLGIFDPM